MPPNHFALFLKSGSLRWLAQTSGTDNASTLPQGLNDQPFVAAVVTDTRTSFRTGRGTQDAALVAREAGAWRAQIVSWYLRK